MPMVSNMDIMYNKRNCLFNFFTTYHLWRLMKKNVMFYFHIFIYWVYQMYRTAIWQLQLYRLLLHSPSKFRNSLTKCTGWGFFCRKTTNKNKDSFINARRFVSIFLIPMNHQTFPFFIPDFEFHIWLCANTFKSISNRGTTKSYYFIATIVTISNISWIIDLSKQYFLRIIDIAIQIIVFLSNHLYTSKNFYFSNRVTVWNSTLFKWKTWKPRARPLTIKKPKIHDLTTHIFFHNHKDSFNKF